MTQPATPSNRTIAPAEVFRQISDALQGLRYGTVEITVHDGRIVQLERREKIRIAPFSCD